MLERFSLETGTPCDGLVIPASSVKWYSDRWTIVSRIVLCLFTQRIDVVSLVKTKIDLAYSEIAEINSNILDLVRFSIECRNTKTKS